MEADLLAAVYAAPLDDAPRLVYSDFLQDRGDPRGDFIALQLAGRDASALVAEHGARWLGDLPATDVTWERGFPAAGRPRPGADPRDPRWRTLHTLAGTAILADAAPLPALRRLVDLGDADLVALGALTRPLPVEVLGWTSARATGPLERRHAVARIGMLPALRRLELHDAREAPRLLDYAWAIEAPVAAHVHEVAARTELSFLFQWLALRRPRRLELTEDALYPWRVIALRGPDDRLSRLDIVWPEPSPPESWLRIAHRAHTEALFAGLAALPITQLTAVRVITPASAHDAATFRLREPFANALRAQGRLGELEFVRA